MLNALRPFLARIIASAVAGLAAWLAAHYTIELDTDAQQQVTEGALVLALAIAQWLATTVYGVVHRALSKRLNPGDAASSHLAAVEQRETAHLKAAERAGS